MNDKKNNQDDPNQDDPNEDNNDGLDENDENDDFYEDDQKDEDGFSLIPQVKFFEAIKRLTSLLKDQRIKQTSIYFLIYFFEYHEWFYCVLAGISLNEGGEREEMNGVGEYKIPEIPKMFFERIDERTQIFRIFKVAVVGSLIPEAYELLKELDFKSFSAEDFLALFRNSNFAVKAKKILNELDARYATYL